MGGLVHSTQTQHRRRPCWRLPFRPPSILCYYILLYYYYYKSLHAELITRKRFMGLRWVGFENAPTADTGVFFASPWRVSRIQYIQSYMRLCSLYRYGFVDLRTPHLRMPGQRCAHWWPSIQLQPAWLRRIYFPTASKQQNKNGTNRSPRVNVVWAYIVTGFMSHFGLN